MTPESLAEIRKRCEAASPVGISERGGELFRYQLNRWHEEVAHEMMSHNEIVGKMKYRDDARFLSHARTDIPLLLDALESAMKVIEAAESMALSHYDYCSVNHGPDSCDCGFATFQAALTSFDEATNGKL